MGIHFFHCCRNLEMPLSGWLIDRIGPRFFMTFGGLLCGAGWAALGRVLTLPGALSVYALAGWAPR